MSALIIAGMVVPIGVLAYLSTLRKPQSKAINKKFQHDTTRQQTLGADPPNGVKNSQNTFAFWNQQPLIRPRQTNLQFHEAEAVTNYHELYPEIADARARGDAGRISYLMADYFRQKDTALQNVITDYSWTQPFIQVRKTEGHRGRYRSMITTRDDPKLEMASRTVPHLKSQPIPKSVTRSYFRPVAYHVPYYELP